MKAKKRKSTKSKPAKRQRRAKKTPPPSESSRASDAKIEQRVMVILQLKLDGAEPWNILHFIAEMEQKGEEPFRMDADHKPLCERTIRGLAQAHERISEACLQHEKNALHKHFAQRRGLLARAIERGELATALKIMKDIATLADLYPAKKTKNEHSGPDGAPIPISIIRFKQHEPLTDQPGAAAGD